MRGIDVFNLVLALAILIALLIFDSNVKKDKAVNIRLTLNAFVILMHSSALLALAVVIEIFCTE